MNSNEFEKLFLEIFGEFVKKPKQVEKLYLDVIKRYSSKGRFYHNLEHIYLMCDLWVQHRDKIQMPSFVFMAIVYHDIIYKIHKSDNEEQSAEYFHNIAFKNHFSLEANEIVYIKDLIR
jgi:predicted metal-dependent HD superfamily phosphohydrolase